MKTVDEREVYNSHIGYIVTVLLLKFNVNPIKVLMKNIAVVHVMNQNLLQTVLCEPGTMGGLGIFSPL